VVSLCDGDLTLSELQNFYFTSKQWLSTVNTSNIVLIFRLCIYMFVCVSVRLFVLSN